MYFDANSLYSWALCNPLPVGKFKLVNMKNKTRFINEMLIQKRYNFFVECNIKYLDLHNDYQLAPEKW